MNLKQIIEEGTTNLTQEQIRSLLFALEEAQHIFEDCEYDSFPIKDYAEEWLRKWGME